LLLNAYVREEGGLSSHFGVPGELTWLGVQAHERKRKRLKAVSSSAHITLTLS